MGLYDEMKDLWEKDPKSFEKKRLELIESHIAKAPRENQLSLRKLQWKIDGICARAENPQQ